MAVSTGVPVNYGTGVKTALETTANATGGVITVGGTIAPTANNSAIVSSGFSLTGSNAQSLIDVAGTWNTSGTPTLIKANVTDTASNANSLLLDLQVGGVSQFRVPKGGGWYTTVGSDAIGCVSRAGVLQFRAGFGGAEAGEITASEWRPGTRHLQFGASTISPDAGFIRKRAAAIGVTDGSSGGGTLTFVARTATQITSDQNNYAPGGNSYFQRWSSDASRTVTGLTFATTQLDGEVHLIVNVGSNNIVLANESASSTAANRFTNSTGADITLSAKQAADVVYDGTTSRWLVFKRN